MSSFFRSRNRDSSQEDHKPKTTENAVASSSIDDASSAHEGSVVEAQKYAFSEDRKIGITGAVFLILNKMIGTGSMSFPYTQQ